MKRFSLFASVVLILVAFNSSYAQGIEEMGVVLDLSETAVSSAQYSFVTAGPFEGNVEISLPFEAEGAVVYDRSSFENINFTISDSALSFYISVGSGSSKIVVADVYFSNIVSQSGGKQLVRIQQPIPENTQLFGFTIMLPQGYFVSELDKESLAVPEPDSMLSDGKRIILNWEKTSPSEDFEAFVTYEQASRGVSILTILIPALIILSAIAAVIIIVLQFKKREKKIVTVGLSSDEKKIYEFVREKGEVNQKDVQNALEFSKPRLSRLIRNLEESGLIEKKPLGRTNILKTKQI
ncbi:MAG: helix-turn-helix domain-containing protein [Candidatus Nanoarchaeia archaeon]|nr:helix-turn-helix domain-containing protein [Candidatus Nanoarchaeia archaeon]MDD5239090.1 helix-turn-helix domain-containing protein [Candidatus Nanoarchaeia archaeon]